MRLASFNIIAAVGSQGLVSFTVNIGRTNSDTFCLFLSKLVEHLDSKDRVWRGNTLILIDNAAYHRSHRTCEFLAQLEIPVLFLGPY
jgi:hypothetical protein